MTPSNPTVLVVGAGPTGLLLAAELLRRGVECMLIDAHPATSHWDRATIVHPRSLEVFASLGIVDDFLSLGVKQHFARLHSAGRVLGEIDLSLCGSRYVFNIGISEEATESILSDYLAGQGGHVVRASRLVELELHADRVTATIEHEGATHDVSARWVVACDGYHSTARQQCGIELAGSDRSDAWAVFDATVVGWPDTHEAIFGYLDATPVVLTSLPNRRWRVYLRPSSPESDLIADASRTLARYLPGLAFADVENPTRFHCHGRVAERFRSARVLLAGDAAHVCSPSQGHGMNSGLQDAFNLAWKLALVCQGHCPEKLLDSYEAERRPVAQKNAASGEAFEQAQDVTDPNERKQRDAALEAAFADPASRYRESIAEAELDIDYAASPIVLGDPHPALGPGARLPNTIPLALAGGDAGGLHELAHRAGHTALLLGGTATSRDRLARLSASLATQVGGPLLEALVPLAVHPDAQTPVAQLPPTAAEQLGVRDLTLLVIRPDGHVGLRADRDHLQAWSAYRALLATG